MEIETLYCKFWSTGVVAFLEISGTNIFMLQCGTIFFEMIFKYIVKYFRIGEINETFLLKRGPLDLKWSEVKWTTPFSVSALKNQVAGLGHWTTGFENIVQKISGHLKGYTPKGIMLQD